MRASSFDAALFGLYMLGMLYVGYRGWKKSRSSSDYLLAGRRLGYPMYVACLAAVTLGGGSTIGGASLGYEHGISGIWLVTWIGLGIIALGVLLGTKLSHLGVLSVSEMLELRYDGRARIVSAVVMAMYTLMVSVTQVIAMGSILGPMLGWSTAQGILLGGSVVLAYTFLGGMWSVSYTDFIQFAFMTTGVFILMVPLGVAASGGFGELFSRLPPAHLRFNTIGYDTILGFFLLFFLGILIGQDIWQRVFTAKSAAVARRGAVIAGVYCIAYAFAVALVGMIARVHFPELDDSQSAFATVAIEMLPVGASGIVLAGSVSALMSTASGTLLASSTVLASDVYRRFLAPELEDARFLRISRALTGVLGASVIATALLVGNVILALDIAYTFLTGAIFFPVMAALFWKRASATGVLASMCVSFAAASAAMIAWGPGTSQPIIIGLVTSSVVLVSVSLASPPPSPEQLDTWEARLDGRNG